MAEWADGDTVAAHVAYGNNEFCSNDHGRRGGAASVLDRANREWLASSHGVRFLTISALAQLLSSPAEVR